jgi:TPR repeat protein
VSPSPADPKPQSDGADGSSASRGTTSESASTPASGALTADKKSDAQATQETQSRLAKDADQRRADADQPEDSEGSADMAQKPTPKPKSVSATAPKPPDPRQNQMLINGEKFLYGRGVRQDCNQALIYFKAAAESSNAPAMSHLGAMYASGHCVTPNRVMAYKWFARASETEPANQWISRSLNMLWRDMTPQERSSVAR